MNTITCVASAKIAVLSLLGGYFIGIVHRLVFGQRFVDVLNKHQIQSNPKQGDRK